MTQTVVATQAPDTGMHNERRDADCAGAQTSCLEIYNYGLLDPAAGASGVNLQLLGATTFGIEVTVPELARHCGLGNIDPQHNGGIGVGSSGISAIEASLTVAPPRAGSTLVTVRPDLDAIGAMGMLALRHAGIGIAADMRSRISRAARADRFDCGNWPGPCPLPKTQEEYADATKQDLALIAVNGAMFDRNLALRDRVGIAVRWIEAGEEPSGYRDSWAVNVDRLIAGLTSGTVLVQPRAAGRIALVTSRIQGALRLGYCLAPLVVAENPGNPQADPPAPRRITITQYEQGHADFRALCESLAKLEPGWGGSSTILGSPQRLPCRLSLESVLEAAAKHIRPG